MRKVFQNMLFVAFAGAHMVLSAAQKPNFLFVLVDDYGIMDVGVEGSTFYQTPNIDRLANSGMRFTRGYATCQVCSPSRASIMTGKYPARHGITDWIGAGTGAKMAKSKRGNLMPPEYLHNLPAEEITLAEALKAGGYVTFFAGKWHLGSKGSWPTDHGFDINKGGWDAGSPNGGYVAPWNNPNLEQGRNGESLTQRLADETVKFIKERDKTKPFLAYLSFYAVHGPLQSTQARWRKYRDLAVKNPPPAERFKIDRTLPVRQVQDHPVYAGLIESMDAAVGSVLDALKELGLEENTVVILTGDNGGVTSGDAYSSSMLPYRGGKGRQWEGGLRVPYYIKAPGVTQPGAMCATPVTGADFYPTMLDLAGLDLLPQQHVDGATLKPLLKGGAIAERSIVWHYPHYGNQGGEPSSVILKGGWKLIHYYADGRNELYRPAEDIGEERDLALSEPERTAVLSKELHEFLIASGARFPAPYADYKSEWAEQNKAAAIQQKAQLERQHLRFLDDSWAPNKNWWGSLVTED
ncbi:MAG: sulfatase [Kiritimatiellae bacterium]|nr:sulfatase [Kiritimatiellia bacterium]